MYDTRAPIFLVRFFMDEYRFVFVKINKLYIVYIKRGRIKLHLMLHRPITLYEFKIV
jgi:hypothetical protein